MTEIEHFQDNICNISDINKISPIFIRLHLKELIIKKSFFAQTINFKIFKIIYSQVKSMLNFSANSSLLL